MKRSRSYFERGFSALACLSATALLFSSSFMGLYGIERSLGVKIRDWGRQIHGDHYTAARIKPYLGSHPERQPLKRGGVWHDSELRDLETTNFSAETGKLGAYYTSTPVSPTAGPNFSWEGAWADHDGLVNSATGNKLTQVHLFGWPCRGGLLNIDFTAYHNSEASGDLGMGEQWSNTYNIYLTNLSGTPVIHWGNGLSYPYGTLGTHCALNFHSRNNNPDGGGDGGDGGGFQLSSYHPSKRLLGYYTMTMPDGTVYTFNTAGYCTTITDRNANAISITLNGSNQPTEVADPTGRSFSLSYTGGELSSVTDPLSRTWSFTVNGSDDMTKITWPSIGSTYYDQFAYSSHCITSHTDRRGNVWSETYDSGNEIATETDPLSHEWTYAWTSTSGAVTDPLSHTRTDNYSSGLLSSREDESSYTENYTSRDTNHDVTAYEDKNGQTWDFTWDSNGNKLTETNPLSHEKVWTYNSFAESLTYTDALSHEAQYTYDSYGNRLTAKNALSVTVETDTYNSYGERLTSTDALSHETSFGYNTNGDRTSSTDPLSHETTYAYDGVSRQTSTTDPLSHTESVAYDEWDRAVTFTHPDSTTVLKTYDPCGNLTGSTDENSHSTTYTFDTACRLTGLSTPNSETETYGYDNANHRTSVDNGRGYTRNYTVTNRGEVATLTMPDSAEEQWAYDGVGHTTAYENPLSQTIDYVFDNASRKTGIDYPTGTDTSFTFDNADRRTGMSDATGSTSWGYDNADRLTSLDTPQGNMSYTLDNAGRRTAMTEPAGSWSYSYDNDNRKTSEENPNSETTSWTFDAASRTTGQTFANGQIDVYGFDNRNRTTSLTHENSSLATISAETYTWDGAGNQTAKSVDTNSWSYSYDPDDQLTEEAAPTFTANYTYDANGNRASYAIGGLTQTYNVDNGDKLNSITVGGTTVKSYGYDAAGRTTSVVTSAGTTTLSYDYEDRVSNITYPSSATNSFSYNGLDTRVGKVDSTGTYTYVRDGAGVTDPVLEDGAANYTPGVSQHRSGSTTFENEDYLGTSTRQTNSSESTTATRSYDAFGNLVASTGTPIGPFGFVSGSGYQEDGDSGLKLLGHRYYDPSTGRFLTRDRAKNGRDWFVYCNGNSLKAVDPLGTAPWQPWGYFALLYLLRTSGAFPSPSLEPGPNTPSQTYNNPTPGQPTDPADPEEPPGEPKDGGADGAEKLERLESEMSAAEGEAATAETTLEVVEGVEIVVDVVIVVG
jgi:RHS repeat-associated protein